MNAEVAALADPKTPTRERPSNGAWPRGARRPGSGSRRTARVEADAEVGTATSSPPTWSNWEIFKSGSQAVVQETEKLSQGALNWISSTSHKRRCVFLFFLIFGSLYGD